MRGLVTLHTININKQKVPKIKTRTPEGTVKGGAEEEIQNLLVAGEVGRAPSHVGPSESHYLNPFM